MAPPDPGGPRSPSRQQHVAERPWPDSYQEQHPALNLQRVVPQARHEVGNSPVFTEKRAAFTTPTLQLGKWPSHVSWRLLHRRSCGVQPVHYSGERVASPLVGPLRGTKLVTGSNAITDQGLFDEGHRPKETTPPMELVVLARARQRRVESTASYEARAAHEDRRGMDHVAVQHVAEYVTDTDRCVENRVRTPRRKGAERTDDRQRAAAVQPLVRGVVEGPQVTWCKYHPRLVHRTHVGPRHHHIGARTQQRHLSRDLRRVPQVVGVEEGDELPPRLLQTPVTRGCNAQVGLADQSGHATELGHYRANVLRGTIVDHDGFDGTPRLAGDAGESASEQIAAVVDRDHDADQTVLTSSMSHIWKARPKCGGKRPVSF